MKHAGWISGLALVVVTNALALWGVYQNRREGPVQTIELTERELPIAMRDPDDSSIRLRLAWRKSSCQFFPPPENCEYLFDRARLQDLGFDCSAAAGSDPGFRYPLRREAFVVLEYDGPRWQQHAEKGQSGSAAAEGGRPAPSGRESNRPRESLDGADPEGSRLFVADAGLSAETLRGKYPDARQYLIVRALIHAILEEPDDSRAAGSKPARWGGYVAQLLPPEIHVPPPFSRELASLETRRGGPPRYRVLLHFGSRTEPWIESVALLPTR